MAKNRPAERQDVAVPFIIIIIIQYLRYIHYIHYKLYIHSSYAVHIEYVQYLLYLHTTLHLTVHTVTFVSCSGQPISSRDELNVTHCFAVLCCAVPHLRTILLTYPTVCRYTYHSDYLV